LHLLSCRSFAANAVRLQLHALAYNLGNFLRTLATPEPIKDWSLTTLKEKLIKIGAKIVSHGRYIARFRWPRSPFREICSPKFCGLSRNCGRSHRPRLHETADAHPFMGVRPDAKEKCSDRTGEHHREAGLHAIGHKPGRNFREPQKTATIRLKFGIHPGNVG
jgi:hypothetical protein